MDTTKLPDEEEKEETKYDWSFNNFLRHPKNEAYKFAFMHDDRDEW